MVLNDTIVALATAPMESAIALIRVSGKATFSIVEKSFSKKLANIKNNKIIHGKIVDNGTTIDDVILFAYKAPKSFTGEDSIEITTHGNLIVINNVIQVLIKNGARLAQPGEFSKRAYFNGKIDLIQAESINDLVIAKSNEAANLALTGIDGKLSNQINIIKEDLLSILAHIEVNIDYPEYEDIEQITNVKLLPIITKIQAKLVQLLENAKVGAVIKNGISTAIIGRPNVGKSSVLNALIKEDKAIVSEIAGTTRDVVEGKGYFEGLTFNFLDTAGIRESEDRIESIGIKKTKEMISKADLVILVTDQERLSNPEDLKLAELVKSKTHIVVYNKSDLTPNIKDEKIRISAKNNEIDPLIKAMVNAIGFNIKDYENKPLLSNARQIGLISKALKSINDANSACKNLQPVDLVEVDVKLALEAILEIRGEMAKENLSDEIFSRFCLGK